MGQTPWSADGMPALAKQSHDADRLAEAGTGSRPQTRGPAPQIHRRRLRVY